MSGTTSTDYTFPERYFVLFTSSFRYESAPNISHETIDKVKTLCGRKVSAAATLEPDNNNLDPDCIQCRKVLARLNEQVDDSEEEAQLRCEACAIDHPLEQLRKSCGVAGCECRCNR